MTLCNPNKRRISASISVDDLAKFVFLENVHDAEIELSLNGIPDAYGLFNFFISLLSQGILMLSHTNSIDIESITPEIFATVMKKMHNAHIKLNVHVRPKEAPISTVQYVVMANNKLVSDYAMHIHAKDSMFIISFDLV
jgi:hypothetical protein